MLLKKANTITTPTAYSNGFLHSVKPEVIYETIFEPDFSTTAGFSPIGGSININQSVGGRSGLFQYVYSGGATTHQAFTAGKHPDNTIYYKVSFDIYFAEGQDCNGFAYLKPDATSDTQSNLTKGVWHSFSYETLGGSNLSRFIPSVNGVTSTNNDGSGFYLDNFIIEENISADFTFQRNSSATRVNELGYIEDVQIIGGELVSNGDFEEIGSELVTNGSFDTDTAWGGDNYVIADGKATINVIGGAYAYISQSESFTSGRAYRLTAQVRGLSGSSGKQMKFRDNYSDTGGLTNSNGIVTLDESTQSIELYWVANSNSNIIAVERHPSSGDWSFEVDNVSVKEVGQDWTFGAGSEFSLGQVDVDASGDAVFQTLSSAIITVGKKYRFTFNGSGYLRYRTGFSGTDGTIQTIPYLPYSVDIVATSNTNRIQVYGSGSGSGTLTSASVKEVTDDTNLPRINYEGFTYAESLGNNIVVNGTFDTDSNWTKGTGWSISGGNASCDGTQTTNSGLTQQGTILGANLNLVVGITYVINLDVIVSQGAITYIEVGGDYNNDDITTSGNYTLRFTPTSTNNRFTIAANADFIGSVDNISVQEVIGDLPVPYSGKGHLLLEGQRTNEITYSEALSNLSPFGLTITDNQLFSPDSNVSASKLEASAISEAKYLSFTNSYVGNNTQSIFWKKGDDDAYPVLNLWIGTNNYETGVFDYTTLTWVETTGASSTFSNVSYSYEDYGNGWYRLTQSYTSAALHYARVCMFGQTNPSLGAIGQYTWIGSGEYFYYWGWQIEQNATYPTSYIPTNGTAVTRLGETCNNATQSFPSEGVLYAEIADLDRFIGSQISISINDGTILNRILLYRSTGSLDWGVQVRTSGSSLFNAFVNYTEQELLEFKKLAIRYKDNDFSIWSNGVLITSGTSGVVSTGLSQLSFDAGTSLSSPFYGKTKMVATFPYLSNDEMECLTGEGYGTFEALAAAYSYTIK